MSEAEATLKEETPDKPEQDSIDTIQPKITPHPWVLEYADENREYVQKQLSYFGKMEFFSLIGETLDRAMQTGLTVNDMLGGGPSNLLSRNQFGDVDSFVVAISKLARYAPDLLRECYVIWLNVPYEEREWAKYALDNLSDSEGIEIIEIFVDQNFEAIRNFFFDFKAKIIDRTVALNKELSQPSKPLKPTRRSTPKQPKS